jgi:hypothetical protein
VTLQEYMAFMISKETENVQSSEEIEMAFRAITSQVNISSVRKDAMFSESCPLNNYWRSLNRRYWPTDGSNESRHFTVLIVYFLSFKSFRHLICTSGQI